MSEKQLKLPISVCILVKNEESNLINSLPALSIFKEVLVYDSGSTDKSLEICEQFGAKVISGEWLGFSESRKKLFSEASQPWIFWLDADEVLTSELASELKFVFSSEIKCQGFEINRMVFFLGKKIRHGEWFPDWNLRIFRADSWRMDDRFVHESVNLHGSSVRLRGLLEHYSYQDWNDRLQRMEHYSNLWAQMKQEQGSKTFSGEGSIRAVWRFFRAYILKFGFLDGLIGFKIAISVASEVSLKYKKLHQLGPR
tara:strand:+ start:1495 stop:2259 length:765 start_codon:yes stop_codon:yes gene_type:complete